MCVELELGPCCQVVVGVGCNTLHGIYIVLSYLTSGLKFFGCNVWKALLHGHNVMTTPRHGGSNQIMFSTPRHNLHNLLNAFNT